MLYLILKWSHILAAIVALGANLTYPLWLVLAHRKPESLVFTLQTVKIIDDWMANPAYVLSFFTGAGLMFVGRIPWSTPWIVPVLVMYGIVSVLGLAIYSPLLKEQIKLAKTTGHEAAEYKSIALRGNILGGTISLMVIVITFLMTVKPQLW
jgi:uncharacterized membrane protein